jgi:hypothetical protein
VAVTKSVVHLQLGLGVDATARVHVERPVESTFGRRFVIIFEEWRHLLKGLRNPTARDLADALPWMLSPSEFRRVDQAVLAAKHGVSQPSISRAMTLLVKRGVIEKTGAGPGVRYRLSPRVGWQGSTAAYHGQQHREQRDYRQEAQTLALHVQLDLALPPSPPPAKKRKEQG